MTDTIKLVFGQKEYEFPLVEGSEGEKAVDISQLRAATGLITLDPGYANTGSCLSAITFMDGEKGILRYRGIPVEELAAKATFKETVYLLINGRLPSREELTRFQFCSMTILWCTKICAPFMKAFRVLPIPWGFFRRWSML